MGTGLMGLVQQLNKKNTGTWKAICEGLDIISNNHIADIRIVTYNPGIMPIKIHHGIPLRGNCNNNGKNPPGYITECILSGVGVLYQSPFKEEAGVEIIKI